MSRLSANLIDIIFLLPTVFWAAAVTSSTKATEVILPAFGGRLLIWKHNDRARCLASGHEFVRGCSLPKRKGFDNVARYHPLGDSIEQGFCSGFDFASVRKVMGKHGTGDDERPATAQIIDEVDRIRNA